LSKGGKLRKVGYTRAATFNGESGVPVKIARASTQEKYNPHLRRHAREKIPVDNPNARVRSRFLRTLPLLHECGDAVVASVSLKRH
jgi:hypothetical protein